MNFQNLEYFVAAATARSFTRAADSLFITQQTLSGQIAQLEKEIGCKLFLRTKPLQLTESGKVFFQYATSMLREYRKMQSDLAILTSHEHNSITIGIAYPGAVKRLSRIISDYHTSDPAARFRIVELPGNDMIERMRKGTIDFGIAHFPELDPAFTTYPIVEEEIVLLATEALLQHAFGADHGKIAQQMERTGDFTPMRNCPYVQSRRNNIVAEFAERYMAEHIPAPVIRTEADSFDAQLEICRNGAAFSFFPLHVTKDTLHDDTLSPFRVFHLGENARFMISYGYLKDAARPAGFREFIDHVTAARLARKEGMLLP